MEEETETECSGFWQPVDRETERVITRGQLETQELGRTGGQAGRQGTAGWAHGEKHEQGRVCLHASCVEGNDQGKERKSSSQRQEGEGRST